MTVSGGWCDPCGVPAGHGRCRGCFALRYPDGLGGVDWRAAWAAEGDVSKLPEAVRPAAWELMRSLENPEADPS